MNFLMVNWFLVFWVEFFFLLLIRFGLLVHAKDGQRLLDIANLCHVIFFQKSPVYLKTLLFWAFLASIVGAFAPLKAQDQRKIDSLKAELQRHGDRYDILWGLAYETYDFNSMEALGFAEKAYSIAVKDGIDSLVVKSGRLTAQLLRRVDKPKDAVSILVEIQPIAEKLGMDGELARILNTLAICHMLWAEYDKALEYHFQSLVLREKEGNKERIAFALMNIALTHYKMGGFDLALEYNLRAEKTFTDAKIPVSVNLYINMGLCYNELKRFDDAKRSFEAALSACGKDCSNEVMMHAQYGLGESLFQRSFLGESEHYFRNSLDLALESNDTRFQLENLIRLIKIELEKRKLESAKSLLDRVSATPEREQYREIQKAFFRLQAEYYSASTDYRKANEYLRLVNALNDSIFHADVIKNLTRVQTQYAQRENLAIIAEKNSILALNERIITQQRSFNVLLVVVLALVTALVVVVYQNNRKIKAVNAELATAKQIIEDHNKFLDQLVDQKTRELVNSNEALVKVNDELDNFIYKTSHDIRGPLASLKGMVNLAIMDVKDDKALGYLSKLDLTAEKLNMILTRLLIVNRINHAELKPELIHFEPIIQEILTLEVKKGIPPKIKVDYEVAPDVHLVSDRDLVRLILENLIDNAVKYYNDSERVESFVKIKVGVEDGKVTARVIDNGVGISTMNRQKIFQMFVRASERSDTGGIGLYLAKIATEKVGGDINLITTGEKYTEFVVQFPATMPKIDAEKRAEEGQRREATLRAAMQGNSGVA